MEFRRTLISSAVAAALGAAGPAIVLAQSADQQQGQAPPAKPVQLEQVVVTGIRESLENAEARKKNSDTIMDSIVADDIGKLPDVTAVEALQRVTGVQIGRDFGEGGGSVTVGGQPVNSGIAIRGLPQVETTLNGREVFTATGSRVLNFEDVPSSLLAGMDVYKDQTADLIEGGVAGTVDLRTRKPFDFEGLKLEANAAGRYADYVSRVTPEVTALASDRWNTGGADEWGALIAFSYQDRSFREDEATQGSPLYSTAFIQGQTVTSNNGVFDVLAKGERFRTGVDGSVQWQPVDTLQFYTEASSEELRTRENEWFFDLGQGSGTPIAGTTTLFPGTNVVQSASFSNAGLSNYAATRDVVDVDRQIAFNGKWTPGSVVLVGDVSYTEATEQLANPTLYITGLVPQYTEQNSLAGVPNYTLSGFDAQSLSNYASGGTYDTVQNNKGHEMAARFDATYSPENSFFNAVSAGIRYANRAYEFVQYQGFAAISGAEIAANAGLFGIPGGSQFFSRTESNTIIPQFIAFNPDLLRYDLAGVGQDFGVDAIPGLTPGSNYSADEKNYAIYLKTGFSAGLGWVPMDGNLGVRLVRVDRQLDGFTPNIGTKPVTYNPLAFSTESNQVLPSLNLRFKLQDDLQLRLAASKSVSQPDFDMLRPSFTLTPASGTAIGGNPNLRPMTSQNYDASLEWYFAQASLLSGAVFYKKLENFIYQNVVANDFTINGVTYNDTSPANGPSGSVKGFEIAYQQFFDFLPSWWSGLGTEINYTYSDAIAPSAVAPGSLVENAPTVTLPDLSRNSFNLVGLYEKGPVTFRLAYNWRSQFFDAVYSGSTAQVAANPVFTKAYGWLDGSLSHDISQQFSAYFQASNLLRTRLRTFYGSQEVTDAVTIDDRQFLLGFRFKL